MQLRRILWPLGAIACLLVGFTFGFAQQQQPTPYWYVAQYRLDFRRTDSLSKLIKTTSGVREEWKRAGLVLEDRWFLHHTGDEWTVLHMRKYPNWASITDQTPLMPAIRKVFPDSARRAAIEKAFQDILVEAAHRDAIYVEMGI
jgi:hypothetical protein